MRNTQWHGAIFGIIVAIALTGCSQSAQHGLSIDAPGSPPAFSGADDRGVLADEARTYLVDMTEHTFAGYRANAIEGLRAAPFVGEEAARRGLIDPNLGVRFVAAMSVGMNGYKASAPLAHELITDLDLSVRAAAMFALKKNGFDVDLSPLADMLRSKDMRHRSNAALVLGELGDPAATQMLRDALTYDGGLASIQQLKIAQLQIAEALVKVGDTDALSRIRAHLYVRNPSEGEVTALAASIMGRLGAKRYVADLKNTVAMWQEFKNSAEIRLAAMASLAQLGYPPELEMVLEYLGPEWQDPTNPVAISVRAQAAYTLGEIGEAGLPTLASLLRDESNDPMIRLQAAAAVLRIVEPGANGS